MAAEEPRKRRARVVIVWVPTRVVVRDSSALVRFCLRFLPFRPARRPRGRGFRSRRFWFAARPPPPRPSMGKARHGRGAAAGGARRSGGALGLIGGPDGTGGAWTPRRAARRGRAKVGDVVKLSGRCAPGIGRGRCGRGRVA